MFSTRQNYARRGNNRGSKFYSPSLNARYNYDASEIAWHCIVNVNETIEIKSLVTFTVSDKADQYIQTWLNRLT